MTRKAKGCAQGHAHYPACALCPLRTPSPGPHLGVGWARCRPQTLAWPCLLAAERGALVRTSPPQPGQDPAPGPAAIKSGCIEQGGSLPCGLG